MLIEKRTYLEQINSNLRFCMYPYALKKWAKNLIDICSAFPMGDNDDIVDTCTQAWLRLRKGWFITHSTDLDDDDQMEERRMTIYG